MLEQDFSRLLRHTETAIDLLKRASIVPGVELYEMLYKYSLGTDPRLTRAWISCSVADRLPPLRW
jgi:hypothetical protein